MHGTPQVHVNGFTGGGSLVQLKELRSCFSLSDWKNGKRNYC